MLRKNLNHVIVFVLLVLQGTLSPHSVSAASTHSVAPLAAGGTVVAWGCGSGYDTDQCIVPAGLSGVTAIAANWSHSLALKNDGTVVAWGCSGHDDGQCTVPVGLSGVTAIAAGGWHSLALKGDGTVVAWGENAQGQSMVPPGLRGVTAIAAGSYHSLALKGDGTVVAWGCGGGFDPVGWGQCTVPVGLSGVTAIAAGGTQSLALKRDGTVVAWGCGVYHDWGQCIVPAGLSDVTAIAAGLIHSLALKSDGTVVAWGNNDYGQTTLPAGLSGVTAIAASVYHSLALKSDGTVVAWGWNDDGQATVPAELTGVTAIAAGGYHSMALVSSSSDSTPPAITIITPDDDATYLLGQLVNANYACQEEDGGSGLASCTGTVPNGSPIDTNSIGAKTFTVDALDNAGNPASLTHHYTVIYNFSGFFQPVDILPWFNSVKGGAGVAVKFRLGGDQGLNFLASGYPLSRPINCDGSLPVDAIEETVTVSHSGLTYDAATGTYIYNWKTEKAWAGACRQLIVKLIDGTEHKANFKFK